MSKKFITGLLIVVIICLSIKLFLPRRRHQPIYIQPGILAPMLAEPVKPVVKIPDWLTEINQINAEVHNLSLNVEMTVEIVTVRGRLFFEKPRNFRLRLSSRLGKELDLGSNSQIFWFWSRRLSPPALYYANYKDLTKTRLKTPFNPMWITQILMCNKLPTENIQITKVHDFWAVSEKQISTLNEECTLVSLVDTNRKCIIAKYLYNSLHKMIASAEATEFQPAGRATIPRTLKINWYEEEGQHMEWFFGTPEVNQSIEKKNWRMPDHDDKINMGIG